MADVRARLPRRAAAAGIALVIACTGCTVRVAGTPGVATPTSAAPTSAAPTSAAPTSAAPTGAAPTGAAPSAVPSVRFTDPEGRFAIVGPPGWPPDTSAAPNPVVRFLDPSSVATPAGPFSANLNVVVMVAVGDLPATVVSVRQELMSLADHRPTEDEARTLPDGTPAHLVGGTFTASGFALRNVQLFTVHDGLRVVVTGTAPELAWDTYAPVFDAALGTLTVVV